MERAALPTWVVGLPFEAIPDPSEVPPLRRTRPPKRMPFENRWRALTMSRLHRRCGWSHTRIAAHFGVSDSRVGQLIRLASGPAWTGR